MNLPKIIQAQQDWETFMQSLKGGEREELQKYAEQISSINLAYYASIDDAIKFDQTINILSNPYLYDTELIPIIYSYYTVRNMQELAYDYLLKARDHLNKNGTTIPADVEGLLLESETTKFLANTRITMDRVSSISPKNIPRISPDAMNDKRELKLFILNELLKALKVIDEKREALRQIKHENRYNDFLQGVLRLRLPVWGWVITDQGRTGTSIGGRDAGSADLVIQSSGNSIALIEAFILKDKQYTVDHILKCPRYVSSIDRYYVVVYCLSTPEDFESKWQVYKADVLGITYPTTFSINTTLGFIDMVTQFDDVNNFRIAKTVHGGKNDLFHILINLR